MVIKPICLVTGEKVKTKNFADDGRKYKPSDFPLKCPLYNSEKCINCEDKILVAKPQHTK